MKEIEGKRGKKEKGEETWIVCYKLQTFYMLNVLMLSATRLNVVLLNVVVPKKGK
jgi:hypothetical protein